MTALQSRAFCGRIVAPGTAAFILIPDVFLPIAQVLIAHWVKTPGIVEQQKNILRVPVIVVSNAAIANVVNPVVVIAIIIPFMIGVGVGE